VTLLVLVPNKSSSSLSPQLSCSCVAAMDLVTVVIIAKVEGIGRVVDYGMEGVGIIWVVYQVAAVLPVVLATGGTRSNLSTMSPWVNDESKLTSRTKARRIYDTTDPPNETPHYFSLSLPLLVMDSCTCAGWWKCWNSGKIQSWYILASFTCSRVATELPFAC
jgi:hypothetical protein